MSLNIIPKQKHHGMRHLGRCNTGTMLRLIKYA